MKHVVNVTVNGEVEKIMKPYGAVPKKERKLKKDRRDRKFHTTVRNLEA